MSIVRHISLRLTNEEGGLDDSKFVFGYPQGTFSTRYVDKIWRMVATILESLPF